MKRKVPKCTSEQCGLMFVVGHLFKKSFSLFRNVHDFLNISSQAEDHWFTTLKQFCYSHILFNSSSLGCHLKSSTFSGVWYQDCFFRIIRGRVCQVFMCLTRRNKPPRGSTQLPMRCFVCRWTLVWSLWSLAKKTSRAVVSQKYTELG